MPILNEIIHTGAYLVSEAHGFFSRDQITMSNAVAAVSGTVIMKGGVPAAETATVTPASDNTGNGVLTMDATAPMTAAAVDGVYTVAFTGATTFNVLDPKNSIIDKGTVGTTFSGPVKFTIAAGATAFAAGDRISVTVLRPDATGDSWAVLDAPGAGLVNPLGILFTHITVPTTPGLQQAVAHVRDCEVRATDITWPVGFTAAQIAEGTLQLKRAGIVLRAGVNNTL